MPIPTRIAKYFTRATEKSREVTQGEIVCPCEADSFVLRYRGRLSRKPFSGQGISLDEGGRLALMGVCPACGKQVLFFDSGTDGYDAHISGNSLREAASCDAEYACGRCGGREFRLTMRLEYTGMDDLASNASVQDHFSWIWIDVCCRACGRKVRNLIDLETS